MFNLSFFNRFQSPLSFLKNLSPLRQNCASPTRKEAQPAMLMMKQIRQLSGWIFVAKEKARKTENKQEIKSLKNGRFVASFCKVEKERLLKKGRYKQG